MRAENKVCVEPSSWATDMGATGELHMASGDEELRSAASPIHHDLLLASLLYSSDGSLLRHWEEEVEV